MPLDTRSDFQRVGEAPDDLAHAIADALNRHSAENRSNTPDFILADVLAACLLAFDAGVNARAKWYGRYDSIGRGRPTPETLAQFFHGAYERLAPTFGHETREATRKPWADLPEQNKALMVAVCAELMEAFAL